MTPKQAYALAYRARHLLKAEELTHHQYALLDCLLWSCRPKGSNRLSVSYSRLQKLAHMARDTVWKGLARLEELGLLHRVKQRVKVRWGLGLATRQATNIYVLDTESAERPAYIEQVTSLPLKAPPVAAPARKSALEQALESLGRAVARPGGHAGRLERAS